jgi:hypothetical protein
MTMTTDPQVFDLAAQFVHDCIQGAEVEVTPDQAREYVRRAAEGMQRAIEAECADIDVELQKLKQGA